MRHVHETHIPYKNITDVKMTKVKTLQWPQMCTLPHFILYVHINQTLPSHYRLEDAVEAENANANNVDTADTGRYPITNSQSQDNPTHIIPSSDQTLEDTMSNSPVNLPVQTTEAGFHVVKKVNHRS